MKFLVDNGSEILILIMQPLQRILDLMKFSATLIGVSMLVLAGIMFATAGTQIMQRDKAKKMAINVIIGLGLIWVAPYIVEYLVQ